MLIFLQTKQILERHVIRAGRSYTVSDLKLLANETHPFVLPTSRDPLRLRVKESDKSKPWVHLHQYLLSKGNTGFEILGPVWQGPVIGIEFSVSSIWFIKATTITQFMELKLRSVMKIKNMICKMQTNKTSKPVLDSFEPWNRIFICYTDYYVEWNGHWIHVFRPDVECTNGIIHVIDEPFVLESDIRATGSAARLTHSSIFFLLTIILARILEN